MSPSDRELVCCLLGLLHRGGVRHLVERPPPREGFDEVPRHIRRRAVVPRCSLHGVVDPHPVGGDRGGELLAEVNFVRGILINSTI